MSDVEKGGKEKMNWVQREDAEWELVVPSWEIHRWRSALGLLLEKPLGKMERLRVKALWLDLEQKGRLLASQVALLKSTAERHETSIPAVPSLPIVLAGSEVAEAQTDEVQEEEPDKEGLWAKFSNILTENGLKPDEHRAWYEEEWALSLRELPPKNAERMMELSAKEVIRGAVPPPVPRVKGPVPAGPLDLLIKDFLEGQIDYPTYERKVTELEKKGE